nr:hypothetical protein [Gemmatimonadaceae bacterium]
LEDDARAVHDQRAESELRAHVGELEAGAWEKAAKDADARLAALGEERGAVEKELASIREMLGAARRPTPAQAAMAIPSEAGDDPADGDRTGREPADGGDHLDSPQAATGRRADAQHDAFAAPVEGSAGGDAPIVSEAAASSVTESEAVKPTRTTGSFDELAFLRDVAGEAEQAQGPATPLAPPRQATEPIKPAAAEPPSPTAASEPELELEPVHKTERPINDSLGLVLPDDRPAMPTRRSSTEIPLAANVTGNAPIILETGGKQDKTLKCTDCGSMNYPTEWYCERCGAELSAL